MNACIINIFEYLYKNINIFFLFFCLSSISVNAAILTVNNGFESGNVKEAGAYCAGNCPKISSTKKKSGKYSAEFILTRDMPTKYRTEIGYRDKNKTTFDFGKEYWISMDYRYEDWKKDRSKEMAPFQIHTTPSEWKGKCQYMNSAITFPFWMMSGDDKVVFNTYKGRVLWQGPIEKKKWLNIIVHFKISYNNDGFIEAWKDGEKIGRIDGPNTYKYDKCDLMRPPYLHMGVYKWDWRSKNNHRRRDSTRRQLYIDNFKVAIGENGYSLVSSNSADFHWFSSILNFFSSVLRSVFNIFGHL